MSVQVVKTTLVEGVAWPEVGEWPNRFKHASKPIRQFKSGRERGKETDLKFEEWLKGIDNGRMAKKST